VPVLGSASDIAGNVPGNPNFANLQPVGAHTNMGTLGPLSDASNEGTYLIQHPISADCKNIAFVYSNTGGSENDGANTITIKASLKMADTGTLRLTFDGQPSITLQPGASVMTDPVACPVVKGSYVQSITFVSVVSGSWPGNVSIWRNYTKEGFAAGLDKTDGSTSGYDFAAQLAFGPNLVLGDTDLNRPVIGVHGDSISHGAGDATNFGHFERAFSGLHAFVLAGQGGVQSSGITTFYTAKHRWTWMCGCTDIVNAYGRNDVGGGVSAATFASRCLTIWGLIDGLGARAWQATILPGTTSTDSWATLGNQTVLASEAVRVQVNDWVRGGAKVDGSGVAVFDGSGSPSPLLTGVLELADLYETARNSGKWKSPAYTADGIHPTTAAYTAAAPAVLAWADALS
jgi:lysophospholipase L1-like esterase